MGKNNAEVINAVASTSQTIFVADMISEGPIQGLVNGEASVYLNNVSLVESEDATYYESANQVTFSGTSTGTFSSNIPNLNISNDAFRFLFLYGIDSVANVTVTHTNGTDTFALSGGGGTNFTTKKTFGVASDLKRFARLVRENTIIEGEVNAAGQFISNNPITSSTSLNASDYTLFIDEAFIINSHNQSTITVGTNIPPSGTYSFHIGPLSLAPTNVTVANIQDAQKINDTSVQFRTGEQIQTPLADVGGVGSTPAYQGNFTPSSISQCAPGSLPTGLTLYSTTGYPSGQSADGVPITIAATLGGFNLSSAQIAEVDELRIPILYNSLVSTSENTGNTGVTAALYDFSIRTQLGGEWSSFKSVYPQHVQHAAEISAPISFEHTIQLEQFRPFDNFEIRITRLSRTTGVGVNEGGGDKDSRYKGDYSATIGTPFSIFKEKFIYPYTAYAGVTFSSETYDNIPQRSYDCKGLKVKIPTTYTTREALGDPVASPDLMYSGFWNGTFKAEKEYTDNPAWIFYDLIENNRYGCGEWIQDYEINKYALYRIARYCDELVSDGNGGLEPRFRANVYLAKAADVYKVLKDMATIFTGMLYFLEGQVTPIIDAPADPVYNFSKGNVIDGSFTYESTGAKTRVNQVIVTWNNPANNYESEALVVEDRNAILREGRIISQTAQAFGATSEGQATRYGRWKLYTAQFQTEIINFKTALQGGFLQPGDIVNVQDADRYGTSLSGRLKAGNTGTTVNLDRTITLRSGYNYELSVLIKEPVAYLAQDNATISAVAYTKGDKIPGITTEADASSLYDDSGNLVAVTWKPFTHTETRTVTTLEGDVNSLTVGATFSAVPSAESIWLLKEFTANNEPTVDSTRQYRILGIVEEEPNIYGISAVEHYDIKYDAIEKDYALAVLPDAIFPKEDSDGSVPPPKNLYVLTISDFKKPQEEIKLQWDAPDYDFIAGYEIEHGIRGEDKIIKVGASTTTRKFNKVKDGYFVFRVRTVSNRGNRSKWTAVAITVKDPFAENVPRLAGGMPMGAVASVSGFIDSNNNYRLEESTYALAPIQTPFDPYINTSSTAATYSQDISGTTRITFDNSSALARFLTSFYIYFDRNNADKLKLIAWDFLTFKNLYYWYDAGNGSQTPTFSALTGTIDLFSGTNKVIGTGTAFTSELDVGDIIEITTGIGAKVVSIVDDELLIIDRSFSQDYLAQTPATTTFQVNFETDSVIARIYWDGAEYHYDNYITIDPDLENLARSVFLDSNIRFINYGADETQDTTYSNITLEASTTGFKKPEFKITGTGFAEVTGTADATWQAGTNGAYSKIIHNSSDIAYNSGSSLPFTVEVRESNDPDNVSKQRSASLTISKIIGGSVGQDAKAVKLTAGDYSIVYDEEGANPQYTGTGGNITLTATSQNFLNPRYKFTGDGIVDETVYGIPSTKSFPVPADYFTQSKVLRVSVSEEGANTEEAYDNISIHAVKPGTDGYTVILSNESHTAPADPDGSNVNLTGSGTTIEVFKGATTLTYTAGTPTEGQYSVGVQANTGMSAPVISAAGVADFTSMTDDTETVTYSINCENVQTVLKKQSFSKALKGTDGSTGLDGRTVKIKTTNQVFSYDEQGDLANPTTSTATATVRGATGSLYYEWFLNTVSQGASTLNDNTYVYNAKALYDDMPDQLVVEVREGSAANPVVASDEYTFYGTKKGENAITVSLTNEAHTIPTDSDGNNGVYTGSGTFIRAWHGNTQCSYGASGPHTFTVSAVGTDITPDATPTTNVLARAYQAASNMTADTAFITFTVTVRDSTGADTVIEKLQTFSKSKGGVAGATGPSGDPGTDGNDARSVKLTTTNQVFSYDAQGNISNPANSTLTATVRNATGSLYYEWFKDGVSQGAATLNDSTYLYTPTATYGGMPEIIKVEVREGGAAAAIVAEDQLTNYGTKKGEDAITVSLTNEAHTIPTDVDGNNGNYAGSGTFIRAWYGNTQCTPGGSGAYTFSVTPSGSNITPGTQGTNGNAVTFAAASNMIADTATITYTVTVRDETGTGTAVPREQTFSKAKAGAAGTDGTDGAAGTPGSDGDNVINGILYYQTITSVDPGVPPAGTYNFTTGTITGATGWGLVPPTITPGTSDTVWHTSFRAVGLNGATTGNLVYGSTRVEGIVMSGLVTFISGTFKQNGNDITTIDGGNLSTGTVSSSKLSVGQAVGSSGIQIRDTANSGPDIRIFDSTGTVRIKLGLL